ncbi:hypothetical protein B2G88_13900 [Natronolimnobius baerhuensis]|uniref:DUF6895 domain-containing protein n=2 Tax=Natronolimnobius baerhuensis TaxID=253108 RepID=A0A202E6J0_9EURY|nr:hypothetical protein B2G88_13900 [Natronolimnobius baerhuensis]
MADASVDWHTNYIEEYNPLVWKDKRKRQIRRKAFSELSLFLQVTSQITDQEANHDKLVDSITETVNDRRYFELLSRYPTDIVQYGYPFAIPATRGRLRTEATMVLERTVTQKPIHSPERYPFVQLHYYHILEQLGFQTEHLDPATILSVSNIRKEPGFIQCNRRDVYAITHNIFYYTNFGIPGEGFPDTIVPTDLSTCLSGLLLRFLAIDDTDAVAELLLAGIIQRQLDPEFVKFVLSWLQTRSENGIVPGSGVRDAIASSTQRIQNSDIDIDSLGEWDENSEHWFHDYHTVIASGLCFAVLEQEWDRLRNEAPTRDFGYWLSDSATQLLTLGNLVAVLSEYKLTEAAPLLESLTGSRVARAYSDVFNACVKFLQNQRTPDDHIGYFTDEQYVYCNGVGTTDTFDREFRNQCTNRCEAALSAVKSDETDRDRE